MKACTKCKLQKPATAEFFYPRINRKGKLNSWCRSCHGGVRAVLSCEEQLLKSAKQRAVKGKLPCTITLNDIRVPGYCPVLGMKLVQHSGRGGDDSPSLDRIIPEKGYVVGNIAVISNRANRIKNSGTAEEHEAIAQYMRNST